MLLWTTRALEQGPFQKCVLTPHILFQGAEEASATDMALSQNHRIKPVGKDFGDHQDQPMT